MAFTFRLSSGVFGLPATARSVDWLVLNDTADLQQVKVIVYACPIGAAKRTLPPGPIELTLEPWTATHNANSVGSGEVFEPGMPVEVVVRVNDLNMLPTIEVWQDMGGTVIAGTRIGPTDFARL